MDPSEEVRAYAHLTRERLPAMMLPYWLRVSRDDLAGGFLLHDDLLRPPVRRIGHALRSWRRPPRPSDDKQVVSQARLVWVLAHAHVHGFDDGSVYLDAASQGRQFLLEHFLDRARGGYRWTTDRFGRPVNDTKSLYAQSFVIYAFVELARASSSREPLDDALALFHTVEHELHDDRYGGWREHAHADWSPVRDVDAGSGMPSPGRKSANALVHWMEATTALLEATGDVAVRCALLETLDLCRDPVFPGAPGATHELFLPDWSPDPGGRRVSYGHNVEHAWLMLQAQRVLGEPLDWERLHTYVDHTLRVGFDHRRGGAFTFGHGDEPAAARHKVWWVQCELVNALCVALADHADERYEKALAQTVTFVERAMTDRHDGILVEEVEEDGSRRRPRKSGNWKAGYHDVRTAIVVAEAFPA
jgi:mannobiose 2-epimerase